LFFLLTNGLRLVWIPLPKAEKAFFTMGTVACSLQKTMSGVKDSIFD